MFTCTNCKQEKAKDQFYKRHKQCKSCFKLKYYDSKREYLKVYWSEHFQNNKERKQEYSKLYKRANRDKTALYARNAYAKDPQRALSYCHNRRTRLKTGMISKEEWDNRLIEFNNCCAYCLQYNAKLEMDHMQALSQGGTHCIDNVVPACRSCNSKKHNKGLVQFIQAGALNL